MSLYKGLLLSEKHLTKNIIKSSRRFPLCGNFFRSRFKKIEIFTVYEDERYIHFALKLDKRCFLSCSDNKMAFGNMVYHAGSDHLAKHNMAYIHDLMVLISIGSLQNYRTESDLITFPALTVLISSTLYLVLV
jgi:hypothetical protein